MTILKDDDEVFLMAKWHISEYKKWFLDNRRRKKVNKLFLFGNDVKFDEALFRADSVSGINIMKIDDEKEKFENFQRQYMMAKMKEELKGDEWKRSKDE